MNMRTLSLAALTLLDVPPPEQVRIAAQAGFTHVGLRLLPATPSDPDYAMLGDTPRRSRYPGGADGNRRSRFRR